MPNCKVCGKSVSCGLVVCGEECFNGINIEPDDVLQGNITLILYHKYGFTTAVTACETEKDVVDRIKLQSKNIQSVYFIETKKLIHII